MENKAIETSAPSQKLYRLGSPFPVFSFIKFQEASFTKRWRQTRYFVAVGYKYLGITAGKLILRNRTRGSRTVGGLCN